MKDKSTDEFAKILFDYNNIQQPLEKSDCILVLGNSDIRSAEYGAKLFLEGYAPLMICAGSRSNSDRDLYGNMSEAQTFANKAIELGVPKEKIFLEEDSTNTGENILFIKKLIKDKGLDIQSLIVIQKPAMLRRIYATLMKLWPEMKFIVSAPQYSFEEYPNDKQTKEYVINIMVGDTQRIKVYAEKGFQIPQDIPDDVWQAYEELVKRGYDKYLIKN